MVKKKEVKSAKRNLALEKKIFIFYRLLIIYKPVNNA
jgi:hypothetical protein